MKKKEMFFMSQPEGADPTGDFGAGLTAKAETTAGEATFSSGYMEAPARVAGAAAEEEGAVRPSLSEG
jgi:hypothetical protein